MQSSAVSSLIEQEERADLWAFDGTSASMCVSAPLLPVHGSHAERASPLSMSCAMTCGSMWQDTDAPHYAALACHNHPVCASAQLANIRCTPSMKFSQPFRRDGLLRSFHNRYSQGKGRPARVQHLLGPEQAILSGGVTCIYRLAFSAVTAPACAPSASMAGMKHDRWSILCFTTPTLQN